jgi:hypothetical protein
MLVPHKSKYLLPWYLEKNRYCAAKTKSQKLQKIHAGRRSVPHLNWSGSSGISFLRLLVWGQLRSPSSALVTTIAYLALLIIGDMWHRRPEADISSLRRKELWRSRLNPIPSLLIALFVEGIIFFCRITGWRGRQHGRLETPISVASALEAGVPELFVILVVAYLITFVLGARLWSLVDTSCTDRVICPRCREPRSLVGLDSTRCSCGAVFEPLEFWQWHENSNPGMKDYPK